MIRYSRTTRHLIIATFTILVMVFFSISVFTIHTRGEEELQRELAIPAQRNKALRETVTEELEIIQADQPALKYIVCQKIEPVTEEVVAPQSEQVPAVNERDVELLACVIYQEAGSDSVCDMCRRRVADVVLNRVSDPRYAGTTIEEILTDANPSPQWGLYSVTGVVWPEKSKYPSEIAAVERAYRIAREVLEGQHSDLTSEYIWLAEFSQGEDVVYCDGIYFGK